MAEGLGLGLGGRGSDEGSLSFGGRGCGREKGDLFGNGAAEVLEGLLDVGRVVVGLVVVGRAVSVLSATQVCELVRPGQNPRHGQHLLMRLLEGIDALLEVDVVGGQLGLA